MTNNTFNNTFMMVYNKQRAILTQKSMFNYIIFKIMSPEQYTKRRKGKKVAFLKIKNKKFAGILFFKVSVSFKYWIVF